MIFTVCGIVVENAPSQYSSTTTSNTSLFATSGRRKPPCRAGLGFSTLGYGRPSCGRAFAVSRPSDCSYSGRLPAAGFRLLCAKHEQVTETLNRLSELQSDSHACTDEKFSKAKGSQRPASGRRRLGRLGPFGRFALQAQLDAEVRGTSHGGACAKFLGPRELRNGLFKHPFKAFRVGT